MTVSQTVDSDLFMQAKQECIRGCSDDCVPTVDSDLFVQAKQECTRRCSDDCPKLLIPTSSCRLNKSVQEDAAMTVFQTVDSDLFMQTK